MEFVTWNLRKLNIELFISRRLFFDKGNKKLLSQRIIRIALAGIALGLMVMIIAVAVVTGFKNEVRSKVIGFGSHIQVINYDSNNSYETRPVSKSQPFIPLVKEIPEVEHVQYFATKPGMIKTDEYIQGIVFKGVDTDYNWDFFKENLVEGTLPEIDASSRTKDILISEKIAALLQLKLNDKAFLYFINEKDIFPRIRQLHICGIYNTRLDEFDQMFVIGDIKQVQYLNDWKADQVTGFEVLINDFFQIERIEQEIRNQVILFRSEDAEILRTESIMRQQPQIFNWLAILDMNVWIILALMVMVAGFNMVSGLLVLILERSTMIGVLKAMGSPNWSIRRVFIYLSVFLTSRGMLWGNIIGVSIVLIQAKFHLFKLDPASYYMPFVPMNFSLLHILLINLGTIIITAIILVVPSYFISKISPDKTIRFD